MKISWEQLGDKLISISSKNGVPIVGQFELTSRCNLSCRMCYVHKPSDNLHSTVSELSAKDWVGLAEQARDAGTLYLLLTGGEVFMRKDFKTIYEEVSMMGFNIELLTNGTMITPEIASWLGRIPPSITGITLYGASADTYGRICGNPEAFIKAIQGIRLLLNEGISVHLKTTVLQDNVKDFDELAEFSFKHGLDFGIVNYISPRRDGGSTPVKEDRLSPEELSRFEAYADKCLSKASQNKLQETNSYNAALSKGSSSYISCTAGRSAYWITSEGKMTPCGIMNQPYTLPMKVGLSEAWRELKEKYAKLPYSMECSNCDLQEYCMVCPARLKNETGFYDKSSEYLCELAKCRRNLSINNIEGDINEKTLYKANNTIC